jgi:hypothetical protein
MRKEGPDLSPEDEARWWRHRGEHELCQILFWRWDPIGVQDELPYSNGEYDDYASQVLSVLQHGAPAAAIASLLARIEEDEMESRRERDPTRAAAAELIVKWYGNSRRYWVEFESDSRGGGREVRRR